MHENKHTFEFRFPQVFGSLRISEILSTPPSGVQAVCVSCLSFAHPCVPPRALQAERAQSEAQDG